MITASINIRNPLWRDNMNDGFRNYLSAERMITKNKFLGVDITRHWYYLLEFRLDTNWSGDDHAGIELYLGLFGYSISLYFRDRRHWNHDQNRWYEAGEEVGIE